MRIYSPEELHPSPNPAEMAKMLGYASMEKACAKSIPEEPICNYCGVECQGPERGKKHACQFCSDFSKGYPSSFYDPGESEGCEGSHWQSMYLPGFPFANGCKYHSKRRVQSEPR